MSEEQKPEMVKLSTPDDATPATPAALVPAAPQYSSRREAREALERAHSGSRAASPIKAVFSRKPLSRSQAGTRSFSVEHVPRARKRDLARRATSVATGPTSSNSTKKHPALVVFVLVIISAFVGGIALPAYAVTPGSVLATGTSDSSSTHLQGLKVNATIDASAVTRNDVSAMSDAEYKAQRVTAASLLAYAKVGPHQAGDDYPWPTASDSLSPLGYYYRQCVDFVAWRLNRDAGVTAAPWKWTWQSLTPGGGNASAWKSAWEAHGWATSATPVVGSVAWFAGNHVAYVKSVDGANVTIEEYNAMASRAYSIRTIAASSVARFLYPPT